MNKSPADRCDSKREPNHSKPTFNTIVDPNGLKHIRDAIDSEFSEEKSLTQAWCFTVKKLGNSEAKAEDYCEIISKFVKHGWIDDIVGEKDSKGKLHIHGLLKLRKGFLRKRLVTTGFHLHLRECTNKSQWLAYIHKDQPKEFVNMFNL